MYVASTRRLIIMGTKIMNAAALAQEKLSLSTFRLALCSVYGAGYVLAIGICEKSSSPLP
jgi:hypothetical protein